LTRASELRELTDDELEHRLAERRHELFNLRFQSVTGALENSARLKIAKREIARILTVVFFFLITLIELPALVVLGLWFVLQLFQGVSGLAAQVNGGVAYWAHVGGFGFGVVVALVFLRGRRRPALRPPAFPTYPERPDLP